MLMVTFQALGAVAIVLGLLGTWLAARRRGGWLLCIASCGLWFPTLWTGEQWVAVANCCLTVGICLRNFRTQGEPDPAVSAEAVEGVDATGALDATQAHDATQALDATEALVPA